MRRALAVLLLLVFSFPLIAPALTATPDDSSLPACCRRNGKHHCMMSGMMMGDTSSSFTVSEKCPYSPFAGVSLMLPHVFASGSRSANASHAPGPSAIVRDAEAGYRISFHRARQKRGPPARLTL